MRTSILSDSQIGLMTAKDIEFYLQDLLLYDNERNRITYQDAFETDALTQECCTHTLLIVDSDYCILSSCSS